MPSAEVIFSRVVKLPDCYCIEVRSECLLIVFESSYLLDATNYNQ